MLLHLLHRIGSVDVLSSHHSHTSIQSLSYSHEDDTNQELRGYRGAIILQVSLLGLGTNPFFQELEEEDSKDSLCKLLHVGSIKQGLKNLGKRENPFLLPFSFSSQSSSLYLGMWMEEGREEGATIELATKRNCIQNSLHQLPSSIPCQL